LGCVPENGVVVAAGGGCEVGLLGGLHRIREMISE
jgi:hypothetical protein